MDELQLVRDIFGEPPPLSPDVVAGAKARMFSGRPAVRRRSARRHRPARRARGWLFPLAAAASVVVIVLASVIVTHLASPTGTQGATATTAQAPRPEFYMTAAYPASGPNVLRLQVRRTAGGAVTASTSIPAANMGWGNNITAAAGDRAFFIGYYPCRSTAVAVTTFYRITITGSGRISGIAATGRPVQGMLTYLAVSPDGSQMAYTALPGKCGAGTGPRSLAAVAVSILDLSTGAVRTWQNTGRDAVGGLSWAPDGRTLVIDEQSRGPGRPDLTVLGLNTASSGGSLQAHSTTLLHQGNDCSSSTCVAAVLAGPENSLTALEFQAAGQQTRALVVSIPRAAGSPRTVLYSELSDRPKGISVNSTGLFADPSGQWVLLWPAMISSTSRHATAGWISGGRLHPLPGVAEVFPQGIAW
ncbi:MAG TPA: hypothetical protein VGL63_10565 [Streptosporangiaceae bacterium]